MTVGLTDPLRWPSSSRRNTMSVVTSFVRELPKFWISVRITPGAERALKRGRIRVTENTAERVGLTGL